MQYAVIPLNVQQLSNMSSQSNNTFDRDLAAIRPQGRRFPLVYNVIVPVHIVNGQITRLHWLEEPEADVYGGVPYTLSIPGGTRCLWVPRVKGSNLEYIAPGELPFADYYGPYPESVRPVG